MGEGGPIRMRKCGSRLESGTDAGLARAIEQRSVALWLLKVECLPETFKTDPRFHALLRRVNLE